jgi:hypothetical protein
MTGETAMTRNEIKPAHINTIEDLREHLQAALELEHATIPPYLCGLYTIRPGCNSEALEIIRTVVLQEMLHMVLAANVLNAIGGAPAIAYPDFVPRYPAQLPIGRNKPITVSLLKFSPEALDTFLQIERPALAHPVEMPSLKAVPSVRVPPGQLRAMIREGELYPSIGEFYAAIEQGLRSLEAEAQSRGMTIFTGIPARQIGPRYYYNSGGLVIEVRDLTTALAALQTIVDQGEGFDRGVDDDSYLRRPKHEVAHYYRFNEIIHGRYYQSGDTPATGPTGASFTVDYGDDAVFNMIPNPAIEKFGDGAVAERALGSARTYTGLLRELERSMNGDPEALIGAVVSMFSFKGVVLELLHNLAPGYEPLRAGPCFQFRPAALATEL